MHQWETSHWQLRTQKGKPDGSVRHHKKREPDRAWKSRNDLTGFPAPYSAPSSSWLFGIRDIEHSERWRPGSGLKMRFSVDDCTPMLGPLPPSLVFFQLAPKIAEWRNISKGTEKSQKGTDTGIWEFLKGQNLANLPTSLSRSPVHSLV